jgi:hypothetical protein
MNPRNSIPAMLLLGLAGTAAHADDAGFAKDIKATIALQGDQVVSSTRNGDSDYTAVCHDGNRYHVFVDAGGRVVVKKL